MSLVRRLARPALAGIFVTGGIGHFKALDHHVQAGKEALAPVRKAIKDTTGLDVSDELLVKAEGAAMVGAGTLFALGRMPRLSATVMAGSLVAPTLVGHAFWKETDPQARQAQQIQFYKNLGLLGGALLAAVDTAGKPGMAYRATAAAGSVAKDASHRLDVSRREAKAMAKQAALEARLAQAKLS